LPDDLPLQGSDLDGDGRDDLTIVREENGAFSHYILPSGGSLRCIVFGAASDLKPLADATAVWLAAKAFSLPFVEEV